MKTYAGNLFFELPGEWDDESQYLYRGQTSDVEIHIEQSPVGPEATPETLLEPIIERLGLVGPLENKLQEKIKVRGQEAITLSLSCQREGDDEATLVRVLVFKIEPTKAVTATGFASAISDVEQQQLDDAWQGLLGSMRLNGNKQ